MLNPNRTVLEAKRFGVYHCQPDSPLLNVSQQMMASDVRGLIVVDEDGFLLGVISQTDLLRAGLETDNWTAQEVRNYMSTEVVTVTSTASLREVAELLLTNRIHRVVAVEEEQGKQRPVAVISTRDLVYHMMKDA